MSSLPLKIFAAALTVAALDHLAEAVRSELGLSAAAFPLEGFAFEIQ